jgi:hypothetical protein
MKKCTKCNKEKSINDFCNNKNAPNGKHWWCKECSNKSRKNWSNKDIKERPWINSYNNAKQRCENPNNPNYPWWGAKGIEFRLTHEDCKKLWERDKASEMEYPTIDRKDNNGHYTFDNCQFLENVDNSMKDNVGHMFRGRYIKYTKIGQYSLDGKLIKNWNSQGEIERELGIDQGSVSCCVNGKKLKSSGGYLWKKIE